MKRRLIRKMILEELVKAGSKGLAIYDLSKTGLTIYDLSKIKRSGQLATVSTNTISQALADFKEFGFVTREEEERRERKPCFITPKGKDALEVVKAVYDIEESGKSITKEELVRKFNETIVEDAVRAGLLRETTPPKKYYQMTSTFTRITSSF